MATEEIVYLVYFRLWWKNRQLWQETLYYPSLCHSEEISSLVKLRQFQRCVYFISHGTALGLNKAFQGRRRPSFPIRPPPRSNFPAPLSTSFLDAHSVTTGFRRLNSGSFTSCPLQGRKGSCSAPGPGLSAPNPGY